ncbi:MAG: hypothetical protein ACK41V_08885 [Acidovorax sp.]|uniref:hypothetical protein n=1 Tax=Acidovorax sp. TaxID=1872122 RepID=UPI003918B772
MKKTHLIGLLLCAASAMALAVVNMAQPVLSAVKAAYKAARTLVASGVDAVAKAFAKPQHLPAPGVAFVAAGAYVLRQAKRVRPEVSKGWRMCPSA